MRCDRIPHTNNSNRTHSSPQQERRSHSLPQPHFIAVDTKSWDWDELILPQSMSSGKSSEDIPALCINSISRLIWGSENLISLSPVSWRLIVLLVVPSSVANSSCVIPSRSRNCLRVANSGLLFEKVREALWEIAFWVPANANGKRYESIYICILTY